MDLLGAHMSIAGGLHLAPERGKKTGCGVIQIFTQNPNRWQAKTLTDADADLFRKAWHAAGLRDIISHDIYLVNLAAVPGSDIRKKSLLSFRDEMERSALLGITKIVMHPGSHLGDGEAVGIRRISAALDELFAAVPRFSGKILLETTAGQGTNLGYTFEQLQAIIKGSAFPDRCGICFDTCHTFAAGYDTTAGERYERVVADFDRILGLDRLQCFHMNDSRKGLGQRVDRHEHIGRGAMGLEPFRLIMNDPRFAAVPKIIETPKGDHDEMDEMNLSVLRGLIGKKERLWK